MDEAGSLLSTHSLRHAMAPNFLLDRWENRDVLEEPRSERCGPSDPATALANAALPPSLWVSSVTALANAALPPRTTSEEEPALANAALTSPLLSPGTFSSP